MSDSIADVLKLLIMSTAAVVALFVYATEFDETEVKSLITMSTALIPYIGIEAWRRHKKQPKHHEPESAPRRKSK